MTFAEYWEDNGHFNRNPVDVARLAWDAARAWQPIETAPKDGTKVDVWLQVHASPRSFGIIDAWRVTEAYQRDGKWFHWQDGEKELYAVYVTHWQSLPAPPAAELRAQPAPTGAAR